MLTNEQRLEQRVAALERQLNSSNFSSLQVFLKNVEVQGVLVLKEYSSDPAPAREGTVAYVDGKLKLCTVGGASPTWVVIGTQT